MTDIFAQAEGLKRRRALLEELARGNLDPQFKGNTGLGQALAHIASAYMASKGLGRLEKESEANQTSQNELLASEVGKYLTQSQGTPGVPAQPYMDLTQPDQPPGQVPGVPAVPPDAKGAVIAALTSRHPTMQQVGSAGLKEMLTKPSKKWTAVNGKIVPDDDPTKVIADLSDPKFLTVGQTVYKEKDLVNPNPKPVLDNSDKFLMEADGVTPKTTMINGDTYKTKIHANGSRELIKIDNSTKITNTVNIPKAESKFMEHFGAEEGKRLSKQLENRPLGIDAVAATAKGIELLKTGIWTGKFAEYKKDINKVASQLKLANPAQAARTEEFVASIGDIVVPALKLFGGNDTDEERRYLEKVSGGDITLEPQALGNILRSVDRKMRRRLAETDSAVEALKKQGLNLPTTGALSAIPAPPPDGGAEVPSSSPAGGPPAKTIIRKAW